MPRIRRPRRSARKWLRGRSQKPVALPRAKRVVRRVPRRAIRKHNRKRPPSELELKVYAWLEEDGIPFVREKAISRCHVDIFIQPNHVVELQGCFWHKHKCLEPECGWKPADRRKILKDAKRHAFLASRDYNVHVFWECEIDKDPQAFRNQIKELAR